MIATTTMTALKMTHRRDSEIRENLLNKLGFFPTVQYDDTSSTTSSSTGSRSSSEASTDSDGRAGPPGKVIPPLSPRSTNTRRYLSLLDYSTQRTEPLHIDPRALGQQDKTVQFAPTSFVIDIPPHRDYPKRVHKMLWNSAKEIEVNCLRNAIEFESDGWDWRKALEDNEFIGVNNELYHPTTYRILQEELNKENLKEKQQKERIKNRKKNKHGKKKKRRNASPNGARRWGGKDGVINGHSGASLTRFADT